MLVIREIFIVIFWVIFSLADIDDNVHEEQNVMPYCSNTTIKPQEGFPYNGVNYRFKTRVSAKISRNG